MLNKQQIEIADYILKYLESAGGKSSIDDYPHKLEKNGFDYFESSFTIDYLIEHTGLIDNWKEHICAYKMLVSLIFSIYRYSNISKHSFRS